MRSLFTGSDVPGARAYCEVVPGDEKGVDDEVASHHTEPELLAEERAAGVSTYLSVPMAKKGAPVFVNKVDIISK